ncbi:MAG: hypothetical protein KDD15_04940 [Lewinella sp.]|nr:hypothetical protein [Lewinella sp.]
METTIGDMTLIVHNSTSCQMIFTKHNLLFSLGLIFAYSLCAQSLNQDTEGFSTVVIPSANLNFDISSNIANFAYYTNLNKNGKRALVSDPNKVNIFGVELKGKEKNGIANILSGGDLAIGASAKTLIGIEHLVEENNFKIADDYQNKLKRISELEKLIWEKQNNVFFLIDSLLKTQAIDSTVHRLALQLIDNPIPEIIKEKIKPLQDSYMEQIPGSKKQKAIEAILNFFSIQYFNQLSTRRKLWQEIDDLKDQKWIPIIHRLFLRGGVASSSFTYDTGNLASSSEDRFEIISFNGWDLELAYNLQRKNRNIYGFSIQAAFKDNLDELGSSDYTFTQLDTTIENGQLSTATTIKAINGDYQTFNRYSLNFDYIKVIPIRRKIGETPDLFLTFTSYLRHHIYSGSKNLNNNTVIGLGLNAFSSKKQELMGGLFVQSNDLFGNLANQDYAFGKRVRVGLIAKYSFSGINLNGNDN